LLDHFGCHEIRRAKQLYRPTPTTTLPVVPRFLLFFASGAHALPADELSRGTKVRELDVAAVIH
jgi:hypothetical protein